MKEMESKTESRYEYRKLQEKRKQMIAPDLFEFACFSFLNNLYIKQTKTSFIVMANMLIQIIWEWKLYFIFPCNPKDFCASCV